MSRTMSVEVFRFDELSEDAKERAREWWRGCIDSNDFDYVIEDVVRAGEMLGIEFDTHPVKLMNGNTRQDVNVWWSGFNSQGDGACFEGTYRYAPGALKKLQKEYSTDYELHRIAQRLQDAQKPYLYKLVAIVSKTDRYCNENSVFIDVEHCGDRYRDISNADDIDNALRDFCIWIYRQLENENDYLHGEKQIDDAIRANEYEFYGNGERV